jgi:hypothetical protein
MNPISIQRRRCAAGLILVATLLASPAIASAEPPRAAPASLADRLHALAVQSMQQGRVAEAYGRFVALADAGHAPSARQALWMCEQGPARFGRDWDCAPHQVQDWAAAARVPVPRLPHHENLSPQEAAGGRRR